MDAPNIARPSAFSRRNQPFIRKKTMNRLITIKSQWEDHIALLSRQERSLAHRATQGAVHC